MLCMRFCRHGLKILRHNRCVAGGSSATDHDPGAQMHLVNARQAGCGCAARIPCRFAGLFAFRFSRPSRWGCCGCCREHQPMRSICRRACSKGWQVLLGGVEAKMRWRLSACLAASFRGVALQHRRVPVHYSSSEGPPSGRESMALCSRLPCEEAVRLAAGRPTSVDVKADVPHVSD